MSTSVMSQNRKVKTIKGSYTPSSVSTKGAVDDFDVSIDDDNFKSELSAVEASLTKKNGLKSISAKGLGSMMSEKSYKGVGVILLVVALTLASFVMYAGGNDFFTVNAVMLACTMMAIVLCACSYVAVSVALLSVSTVAFIAFKIYRYFVKYDSITDSTMMWVVLPAMAVAGMYLFEYSARKQEIDNALMRNQISELVLIDPLTGLYNLRSMYMDMQTQISYATRNETPITLMLIKLRYPKEMQSILNVSQYETVLKEMSRVIVDTVRLEDRVYSLGREGTFGCLITTDTEGARLVEDRIRNKLDGSNDALKIGGKPVRIEVKIGYKQYKQELYKRDAKAYMDEVSTEADYDV